MKKIACILGIILSIALIALGVYALLQGVPNASFSGLTVSSTSFGADFYTYSYKATRAAANNVDALGDFLEELGSMLIGGGMTIAGLFGLLLSLYGLSAAKTSAEKLELLRKIANKQITATVSMPAAPVAAPAPAKPAEPVAPVAPVASAAPAAPVAPAAKPAATWHCPVCAMDNADSAANCVCCGEKKPEAKA